MVSGAAGFIVRYRLRPAAIYLIYELSSFIITKSLSGKANKRLISSIIMSWSTHQYFYAPSSYGSSHAYSRSCVAAGAISLFFTSVLYDDLSFLTPSISYQYFASQYPTALNNLQYLIYQPFISLILHILQRTHHINMHIIPCFLRFDGSRPWNLGHCPHHYSSFHQIKQSIFQPIYHHFYVMYFRKDYFHVNVMYL